LQMDKQSTNQNKPLTVILIDKISWYDVDSPDNILT
jgi:hypothetical protein